MDTKHPPREAEHNLRARVQLNIDGMTSNARGTIRLKAQAVLEDDQDRIEPLRLKLDEEWEDAYIADAVLAATKTLETWIFQVIALGGPKEFTETAFDWE